jgi:hypothetical protein
MKKKGKKRKRSSRRKRNKSRTAADRNTESRRAKKENDGKVMPQTKGGYTEYRARGSGQR